MHTEPSTPKQMMDSVRDLEAIAIIPPPTYSDPVFAEGYLKKIRGFGQNRRRFFRVTLNHFAFYARDCGELISYVKRSDISELRDLGEDAFEVVTSVAFGASGSSRMILRAKNAAVKTRWLAALRKPLVSGEG